MKITNHLLTGNNNLLVDFKSTPNKRGKLDPQYLVMHYTAATQAKGSINWFLNKQAQASAHLIIDRDGTITQFAPFNIVTWHAGRSQWNGVQFLNRFSIGIELVNGGRLVRSGGVWMCPVDKKAVAESDVIIATHKNETKESGWQMYTDIQIETAIEVATELVRTYELKEIVGHDDISPFRKSDPGPAFPMGSFQSKAMGRKENAEQVHLTSTKVNIRTGAGTQFPRITEALPKNTAVHILKRDGNWSFVEVTDVVHELNDLEGWIFSKYLVRT